MHRSADRNCTLGTPSERLTVDAPLSDLGLGPYGGGGRCTVGIPLCCSSTYWSPGSRKRPLLGSWGSVVASSIISSRRDRSSGTSRARGRPAPRPARRDRRGWRRRPRSIRYLPRAGMRTRRSRSPLERGHRSAGDGATEATPRQAASGFRAGGAHSVHDVVEPTVAVGHGRGGAQRVEQIRGQGFGGVVTHEHGPSTSDRFLMSLMWRYLAVTSAGREDARRHGGRAS